MAGGAAPTDSRGSSGSRSAVMTASGATSIATAPTTSAAVRVTLFKGRSRGADDDAGERTARHSDPEAAPGHGTVPASSRSLHQPSSLWTTEGGCTFCEA
ncbi:hypothetical protein GCM10010191_94650 [Actinomadura vinacea]|uniref:Uncharacterized protein n=1 Tax=Actinomadura vinacea TaxID=115336 RepID=A0ABN3KH18_9ACTN